jgi:hypothetical protein
MPTLVIPDLSCAGSTRASIKKVFVKVMDCRVKPGNDGGESQR